MLQYQPPKNPPSSLHVRWALINDILTFLHSWQKWYHRTSECHLLEQPCEADQAAAEPLDGPRTGDVGERLPSYSVGHRAQLSRCQGVAGHLRPGWEGAGSAPFPGSVKVDYFIKLLVEILGQMLDLKQNKHVLVTDPVGERVVLRSKDRRLDGPLVLVLCPRHILEW